MTSRMVRVVLGALLCFVLAGRAAAAAESPRDKAKAHFLAGEAKYKAGDYTGAIVDFRAADALVPSPILSFNIALCHEKLGQLEDAVKLYRDYLARRPDAPNRAQLEGHIQELETRIAASAAPPAPPQPEPTDVVEDAPPPEPAPTPVVEPAPTRRYDDALARRVPTRGAVAAATSPYAQPPAPSSAPPPAEAPPPEPKKSTPVYKQWWFWVVVGVSALILIDVASGSDSSGDPQPGGIILRF